MDGQEARKTLIMKSCRLCMAPGDYSSTATVLNGIKGGLEVTIDCRRTRERLSLVIATSPFMAKFSLVGYQPL